MIKSYSLHEYLFFLGIFFLTLQGFYIHSLGFSPFILLGISIFIGTSIILKTGPIYLRNMDLVPIFLLSIILLIATLNSMISGYFDIKRFVGFAIFIPLYISLLRFKVFDPLHFLKYILIIHISIFYLQFILYYGFSIEFDPIREFTGRSQKGWGGSYNLPYFGNIIRFGGLFNEPGSYSTFVAILASLLNIKYTEHKNLIIFASISMMLSFSTFGFVFASFLFMSILFHSKYHFKIITIFIFIFIFFAISEYFFIRFFSGEVSGNGLEFRFELLQKVYETYFIDISYVTFFGLGFFNLNINEMLNFDNPINDAGLFIYIFVSMGLVGLSIFFLCTLVISRFRLSYLFPFLILFFSKFNLAWPLFVVVLYLLTRSDKIIFSHR